MKYLDRKKLQSLRSKTNTTQVYVEKEEVEKVE